jgi:rhodanese-related sulfurtransferase
MRSFFKKLFGSSTNLQKLVAEGAVIIDVRTKKEYETGHIEGSKNIALDLILEKVDLIKKITSPIIIVCKSGRRSNLAKILLELKGIKVYNGGSWIKLKNCIGRI